MVEENFQIYAVQITRNAFANQEIASRHFYSYTTLAKLFPSFFLLPTGRGKLLIPQGVLIWKSFLSPAKIGKKELWLLHCLLCLVATCFLFLLEKGFNTIHKPFLQPFFIFLIIFSWKCVHHFLCTGEKKLYIKNQTTFQDFQH